MFHIIVFLLGIIIGSFLNVCIYRIPKEESIAFPPSHCTTCNNKLNWYDLIPVFSYILLKGKCRNCDEKISIKYPIVELFTGIMFLLVYIKYGLSLEFLKYIFLIVVLIPTGVIDFETTDVYFKISFVGIVGGIIFLIVGHFYGFSFIDGLIGGAIGGGLIALIILLTQGMGWGDFEICLMCGIFLGWKMTIVMLFFSFIFGGAVGAFLMITKKKKGREYMPFGPFIVLGTFFTIYFGEGILKWYLSIL